MTKRDMIADFLSVKQLSNMFCENGVLEAAACAVVLRCKSTMRYFHAILVS
jgi:hypothetical protein